jgi:type I restriction enzyme R subunit
MHPYNEDHLVEHPAILLFQELGWQFVLGHDETFGSGGKLGRETPSDVILIPRLSSALEKLNPGMPAEGIRAAVDELQRDRSAMLSVAANEEIYQLL